MAVIISNERELVEVLEQQDTDVLSDIRFSEWLSFELSIRGDGYEGGIPPRIMPAFIQVQRTMDRLYLRSLGKTPGAGQRLSPHERRQIAISVLSDAGASTRFCIDLTQPLNNALTAAVNAMTGDEILIAVLGLGLIWGVSSTAKSMWKVHVERKLTEARIGYDIKRIDYDMMIKDTEQRHLDIIEGLQNENALLRSVMGDVHEVHDTFLRKHGRRRRIERRR